MSDNTKYIDDVMADNPLLLSCAQTADILNISRASVYRLMETGELDAVRIHLTSDSRPTRRVTNESVHNLIERWMNNTD